MTVEAILSEVITLPVVTEDHGRPRLVVPIWADTKLAYYNCLAALHAIYVGYFGLMINT